VLGRSVLNKRISHHGVVMRLEILSQLFRPRPVSSTTELVSVRDVIMEDDAPSVTELANGCADWMNVGVTLFVHVESVKGATALATALAGADGTIRTCVSLHARVEDAALHARAIAGGRPVVLVCSSRTVARSMGLLARTRVDTAELNHFASVLDGAQGVSWADELSLLEQAVRQNDEAAWLTWSETVRLDLAALIAAGSHSLRIH
jgi:hypothetical protein